MEEKIEKEEKNRFTVDHRFLKVIYDETKLLMDEPLKDFKELEQFHNGMIDKRKKILQDSLESLKIELDEIEKRLDAFRQHYEMDYVSFNSLLREKFDEKYEKYSDNKIKLSNYNNDYEYVKTKFQEKAENNKKKIADDNDSNVKGTVEDALNEYFKVLTEKITGETYKLLINLNKDEFPIQAVGLNGKPGTGIKKALIACFDMAHINLIINRNYDMPHFIIHDKLENSENKFFRV